MINSKGFIDSAGSGKANAEQQPRCPKCRSMDTLTAAKRPTPQSYWRCLKCGEVWNPVSLSSATKQWWQR